MTEVLFFEKNRLFRSANFYPENMQELPKLYSTEDIRLEEKVIHHHFYLGDRNHWYLAELDCETGLMFGFAVLNGDMSHAEWGYQSIVELEGAFFDRYRSDFRVISRDTEWVPKKFKEILFPF